MSPRATAPATRHDNAFAGPMCGGEWLTHSVMRRRGMALYYFSTRSGYRRASATIVTLGAARLALRGRPSGAQRRCAKLSNPSCLSVGGSNYWPIIEAHIRTSHGSRDGICRLRDSKTRHNQLFRKCLSRQLRRVTRKVTPRADRIFFDGGGRPWTRGQP